MLRRAFPAIVSKPAKAALLWVLCYGVHPAGRLHSSFCILLRNIREILRISCHSVTHSGVACSDFEAIRFAEWRDSVR